MRYTISLFSTTYPRFPGDYMPAFVFGQARALVEAGHEVHVFVPFDSGVPSNKEELHEGVHVHRFHYWWPRRWEKLCYGSGIPDNFRRNRLLAIQLPFLILAFNLRALPYVKRSDIVQGHWTFGGMAAYIAAKIFDKPLVIRFYSAGLSAATLRLLNRFLIAQADGITVNSRFTAMKLREIAPEADLLVHPEGIDREKIASGDFDRDGFLRGKGIDSKAPVVLAVGRLIERKGFHVLIEAVPHLLAQQPLTVVIGGRGPQLEALQQQIDGSGLGQHVRLLGFVEDDDLARWYRAADVFVLPALEVEGKTEGLGMVLPEALINQTPVIASEIGGITDIIRHEETGLLVKSGDAVDLARQINRLLADGDLQQRIVQQGKEHVHAQFGWSAITDQIQAQYQSILKARKRD